MQRKLTIHEAIATLAIGIVCGWIASYIYCATQVERASIPIETHIFGRVLSFKATGDDEADRRVAKRLVEIIDRARDEDDDRISRHAEYRRAHGLPPLQWVP